MALTAGNHVYKYVETARARHLDYCLVLFTRLLLGVNAKLTEGITAPDKDLSEFKLSAFRSLIGLIKMIWLVDTLTLLTPGDLFISRVV